MKRITSPLQSRQEDLGEQKNQGGNITFLPHLSPTQFQSSSLSQSAWLSQVTGAPYPKDSPIPHTEKKGCFFFLILLS